MVRHEGLPVRGKGVTELPASVRSVAETALSVGDARLFWQGLGFQVHLEMVRTGCSWSLCWASHSLQVSSAFVPTIRLCIVQARARWVSCAEYLFQLFPSPP